MSEAKIRNEEFRRLLAKNLLHNLTRAIRPLGLLKETIEKEEWFKGLILSTTYFEMFGLSILHSYFRQGKKGRPKQDKIVTDFFDRLGVMKIIRLLYLCDFIKLGTYKKMKAIVKERHNWIHRAQKEKKKDFSYLIRPEQQDIEKAMKLIAEAIDCLKELGVSD